MGHDHQGPDNKVPALAGNRTSKGRCRGSNQGGAKGAGPLRGRAPALPRVCMKTIVAAATAATVRPAFPPAIVPVAATANIGRPCKRPGADRTAAGGSVLPAAPPSSGRAGCMAGAGRPPRVRGARLPDSAPGQPCGRGSGGGTPLVFPAGAPLLVRDHPQHLLGEVLIAVPVQQENHRPGRPGRRHGHPPEVRLHLAQPVQDIIQA